MVRTSYLTRSYNPVLDPAADGQCGERDRRLSSIDSRRWWRVGQALASSAWLILSVAPGELDVPVALDWPSRPRLPSPSVRLASAKSRRRAVVTVLHDLGRLITPSQVRAVSLSRSAARRTPDS